MTYSHSKDRWVNDPLRIDQWGTSAHLQLRLRPAEQGPCARPCLVSSAPEYIRSPGRILQHVSPAQISLPILSSLTHAMSTRALAVTLSPQLVALVTGSANSPSNGACGAGAVTRPPISRTRSIVGVQTVQAILASELGVLVDVRLLLKLLEGVLRAMRQGVQAGAV